MYHVLLPNCMSKIHLNMQQEKLSIRFFIRKSRKNSEGKSPIYCRLTYLKVYKDFATGMFTPKNNWSAKLQSAIDDAHVNSQLKIIEDKLNKAYLYLQLEP